MANISDTYRVAVIGAGASGLAAIKCCLDEGLAPTCYEKSQGIGGLWRYTEKPEPGRAGVYKSTTINTSKELLAYSTFPPPPNFPNFMPHSKLYEYMTLYAREYKLHNYIQFNTEVLVVQKTGSFAETGKWIVTTTTKKEGQEIIQKSEVFDAVMVCTGHHAYPNNPAAKIRGFDDFKGRIFHGHDYRDHKPYDDRRVMVVGLGNTGGDIAAELSRHASKVFLSTRRGAWVINRLAGRGIPYDCEVVTRGFSYLIDVTPYSVLNWTYEKKMNDRFDHELYGLKPKHRIMSQHPLVNDELPARIANGTVTVVPDVTTFQEHGVVTSDGIFHEVDDIIFATGYVMKFPFLPDDIISVDEDNTLSPLYKHVFPLTLSENPTIALIGNVQPLGGLMPIAEMQSRWVSRVFKRVTKLPPKSIMEQEVENRANDLQKRYVHSKRHTVQVDYIRYMDSVADEIQVRPNVAKLFLTDPALAWQVLTGPASSYQYRLHGPGFWGGAPHAIATQWNRIYSGFNPMKGKESSEKRFSELLSNLYRSLPVGKLVGDSPKYIVTSFASEKLFSFFALMIILMSATLILALF